MAAGALCVSALLLAAVLGSPGRGSEPAGLHPAQVGPIKLLLDPAPPAQSLSRDTTASRARVVEEILGRPEAPKGSAKRQQTGEVEPKSPVGASRRPPGPPEVAGEATPDSSGQQGLRKPGGVCEEVAQEFEDGAEEFEESEEFEEAADDPSGESEDAAKDCSEARSKAKEYEADEEEPEQSSRNPGPGGSGEENAPSPVLHLGDGAAMSAPGAGGGPRAG